MAGGSEWAKYTPEQREARRKAQSERCRLNNLKRSKEMRTRIARNMGLSNKGRKQTEEHRIKAKKWLQDPVKMANYREKQRQITKHQYATDPQLSEIRKDGGRENLRNFRREKVSEEDWWARNFKVSRHKKRIADTRNRLAAIGLDVLDAQNVSEEYLDEVDEFFGEMI